VKPPRKATAEQQLQNGHIAARIREWQAAEEGRDIPALNVAMGMPPDGTAPYSWAAAISAPNQHSRPRLAQALGCTPEDLIPKRAAEIGVGTTRAPPGEGPRYKARVANGRATPPPGARPGVEEPYSLVGEGDGTSTLRLTVRRPTLELLAAVGVLGKAGLLDPARTPAQAAEVPQDWMPKQRGRSAPEPDFVPEPDDRDPA
jgi:hypothetical protein